MTTSRIDEDANGVSITPLNPQLVNFNLMLAERRRKDGETFRHLNGQHHIAQMVHDGQNRAFMLAQAEPTTERRDYEFKRIPCYSREVLTFEHADADLIGKPPGLSKQAIDANRRNAKGRRIIIDGEPLSELLAPIFRMYHELSTQQLMAHIYSAFNESRCNPREILNSRGQWIAIEYDFPRGTKIRPGESMPYRRIEIKTVRNRRSQYKKSR